MNHNFDWYRLADKWPSELVCRSEVSKFSGGILQPRTMANLDSLGQGPKERVVIGRKVAYPVAALVEWMKSRAREGE